MSADTDTLLDRFTQFFGGPPAIVSEAPGRVNLIGEHTDYNEGFVLPVAIDRSVAIAAAPSDEPRIRAVALDTDECDDFALDDIERSPDHSWRNYVRGCVWALKEAGYRLRGAILTITGDVPQGAGLSSSAALELAIAGALCAVAEITVDARELALVCQKAENEFVGVQCGIMDQFVAALGRADHALLIDCRSLATDHIPLPSEIAICIVDSGVSRNLADTPYNERREECAEAARMLGLVSLRDADESTLTTARLPEPLHRRARHVVTENKRVLAAIDALRTDQLGTVGALLNESHASLRDDFHVSTAQLDMLVDLASGAEGVLGARLTGGGFGGCTVNLVHRDAVASLRGAVLEPYRQRTGLDGEMYGCQSADGLKVSRV